jgi:hypothetical protein
MTRRGRSRDELQRLAQAFHGSGYLASLPIAVFCTGPLARAEAGRQPDVHVFAIAEQRLRSSVTEYKLLAAIIDLQNELELPAFCSDGRYLKIWFVDDLKRATGTQRQDSESLFTTRIQLLLESEPVLHAADYRRHLRDVAHRYCRDDRTERGFRPLSLVNDILRYWRTICLNDEDRRFDAKDRWRKRTLNLKFSEMVTAFSTVLAIATQVVNDADELVSLCRIPPLDRLAMALDVLDDPDLTDAWPRILDIYEESLTWADTEGIDIFPAGANQEHVDSHAQELSTFLYGALTHHRIQPKLRRCLLL